MTPPMDEPQRTPTEPGKYWARDIVLDMLGNKMLSSPYQVEVVADVPNARGHKLLVKTGGTRPRYRSLNCYEWGAPTEREVNFLHQLASQPR